MTTEQDQLDIQAARIAAAQLAKKRREEAEAAKATEESTVGIPNIGGSGEVSSSSDAATDYVAPTEPTIIQPTDPLKEQREREERERRQREAEQRQHEQEQAQRALEEQQRQQEEQESGVTISQEEGSLIGITPSPELQEEIESSPVPPSPPPVTEGEGEATSISVGIATDEAIEEQEKKREIIENPQQTLQELNNLAAQVQHENEIIQQEVAEIRGNTTRDQNLAALAQLEIPINTANELRNNISSQISALDSKIDVQESGLSALERAIKDKLDRGIYKTQAELDTELADYNRVFDVLKSYYDERDKLVTQFDEANAAYTAAVDAYNNSEAFQIENTVSNYLSSVQVQTMRERGANLAENIAIAKSVIQITPTRTASDFREFQQELEARAAEYGMILSQSEINEAWNNQQTPDEAAANIASERNDTEIFTPIIPVQETDQQRRERIAAEIRAEREQFSGETDQASLELQRDLESSIDSSAPINVTLNEGFDPNSINLNRLIERGALISINDHKQLNTLKQKIDSGQSVTLEEIIKFFPQVGPIVNGTINQDQADYLISKGILVDPSRIRAPGYRIRPIEDSDTGDFGNPLGDLFSFIEAADPTTTEGFHQRSSEVVAAVIETAKTPFMIGKDPLPERIRRLAGTEYASAVDKFNAEVNASKDTVNRLINTLEDPLTSVEQKQQAANDLRALNDYFNGQAEKLNAAQPGLGTAIVQSIAPRGVVESAILVGSLLPATSLAKIPTVTRAVLTGTGRIGETLSVAGSFLRTGIAETPPFRATIIRGGVETGIAVRNIPATAEQLLFKVQEVVGRGSDLVLGIPTVGVIKGAQLVEGTIYKANSAVADALTRAGAVTAAAPGQVRTFIAEAVDGKVYMVNQLPDGSVVVVKTLPAGEKLQYAINNFNAVTGDLAQNVINNVIRASDKADGVLIRLENKAGDLAKNLFTLAEGNVEKTAEFLVSVPGRVPEVKLSLERLLLDKLPATATTAKDALSNYSLKVANQLVADNPKVANVDFVTISYVNANGVRELTAIPISKLSAADRAKIFASQTGTRVGDALSEVQLTLDRLLLDNIPGKINATVTGVALGAKDLATKSPSAFLDYVKKVKTGTVSIPSDIRKEITLRSIINDLKATGQYADDEIPRIAQGIYERIKASQISGSDVTDILTRVPSGGAQTVLEDIKVVYSPAITITERTTQRGQVLALLPVVYTAAISTNSQRDVENLLKLVQVAKDLGITETEVNRVITSQSGIPIITPTPIALPELSEIALPEREFEAPAALTIAPVTIKQRERREFTEIPTLPLIVSPDVEEQKQEEGRIFTPIVPKTTPTSPTPIPTPEEPVIQQPVEPIDTEQPDQPAIQTVTPTVEFPSTVGSSSFFRFPFRYTQTVAQQRAQPRLEIEQQQPREIPKKPEQEEGIEEEEEENKKKRRRSRVTSSGSIVVIRETLFDKRRGIQRVKWDIFDAPTEQQALAGIKTGNKIATYGPYATDALTFDYGRLSEEGINRLKDLLSTGIGNQVKRTTGEDLILASYNRGLNVETIPLPNVERIVNRYSASSPQIIMPRMTGIDSYSYGVGDLSMLDDQIERRRRKPSKRNKNSTSPRINL